MALHSLYCADVPWRNCSLTHYHWWILVNKDCHYTGLNSAVMFLPLTFSLTRLVWFDSCSRLESAFRPKRSSCGRHSARRHSARSAVGLERWSAFRPVGIQATSRFKLIIQLPHFPELASTSRSSKLQKETRELLWQYFFRLELMDSLSLNQQCQSIEGCLITRAHIKIINIPKSKLLCSSFWAASNASCDVTLCIAVRWQLVHWEVHWVVLTQQFGVYYIEVYFGVLTVLLPGASWPSTNNNNSIKI